MSIFNLKEAARPNILNLKPYRCARDDFTEGILLDANENAYGAIGHTSTSHPNFHLKLNRYPDPHQVEVKNLLLQFRPDIKSINNIFIGVGSDEVIDIIMRIFCRPSVDKVLVTPPTYGMYSVTAQVNDVEVIKSNLSPKQFQLNLDEIKSIIDTNLDTLKVIFLCSPGNPTGTCLSLSSIEEILNYPYKGVVVVDEAYIDFASEPSTTNLVNKYPNLIVMQTLSKSFGLAGVRLGVGFSHPDIIQLMNNTKAPYNVSSLSSNAAIQALSPTSIQSMQTLTSTLNSHRTHLLKTLSEIPDFGQPLGTNDANFILIPILGHTSKLPSNQRAHKIYMYLAEQLKVVIRYRAEEPNCKGCLRMTIGTEHENQVLIESIRKALEKFQID